MSTFNDSRLLRIFSVFVPILLVGTWTLAYTSHQLDMREILESADSLYLEALYIDLFQRGGHWTQWSLTPAPYFFHDMALYFAVRPLVTNHYWGFFWFGLAQVLLLYGLALHLGWRVTRRLEAVMLTRISLLFGFSILAFRGELPYSYIYRSAWHIGVLIAGLLLLTAITYFQKSRRNALWMAVSGLIIALAVASDLFFIPVILGPIWLTILVQRIAEKPDDKSVHLLLCMALACGAGVFLKWLLTVDMVPPVFEPPTWEKALNLPRTFVGLWKLDPAVSTVVLIYYFVLWAESAGWFIQRLRGKKVEFPFWSFFLVTSGSALSFLLMYRGLLAADLSTSRYLVSIPWLCLLMPWVPFRTRFQDLLRPCFLLGSITCLVVVALYFPVRRELHSGYRPVWIQKFDSFISEYQQKHDRKLKRGVATYWQVKPTMVLSGHDLTIGQYTSFLNQYPWISSASWYKNEYDFALVSRRDEDQVFRENLLSLAGKPEAVYDCGGRLEVLVFPPGRLKLEEERFKNQLLFDVSVSRKSDSAHRLPGGEVRSPKSLSGRELMVYGPYLELDPGNYRLRFSVDSVSGKDAEGSFTCEVVMKDGVTVLSQRVVPAQAEVSEVLLDFSITEPGPETAVGFRVWKEGPFELTLTDVQIVAR